MLNRDDIKALKNWISETNSTHCHRRQSCETFRDKFKGFFRKALLKSAFFVIVENELPSPNHLSFGHIGIIDFINKIGSMDAITYNDTYYIKSDSFHDFALHFHELIHVIQWQKLGMSKFLERYVKEIMNYGYDQAPLEKIAHRLDKLYQQETKISFNVGRLVTKGLRE